MTLLRARAPTMLSAFMAMMMNARCDPSFSCSGTTIAPPPDAGTPDCDGCPASTVSTGAEHTCATLVGSGTTHVACWGRNDRGQVLDEHSDAAIPPTLLVPVSSVPFRSVEAGTVHTCAEGAGVWWCWGEQAVGISGAAIDVPYAFTASSVALGGAHTCAATLFGLICRGDNAHRQLGLISDEQPPYTGTGVPVGDPDEDPDAPRPFPPEPEVAAMDGGGTWTCAALLDGTVDCWGARDLWLGGDPSRRTVVGIADARAISVGGTHACAIESAEAGPVRGRASCWGSNRAGELGQGTMDEGTEDAVPIALADVRQISAGGFVPVVVTSLIEVTYAEPTPDHTCAIAAAGDLYCWGANDHGQLGTGDRTPRATPTLVRGDVAWVSAGGRHTCVVDMDGGVFCWGDNTYGQLGVDPSLLSSSDVPVRVPLD